MTSNNQQSKQSLNADLQIDDSRSELSSRDDGDSKDSDEDVSSGWSAHDSIDLEIKAMRRKERREERRKKKADKPVKLMIEKELKVGELDRGEKQKLKEIVSKGKRVGSAVGYGSRP